MTARLTECGFIAVGIVSVLASMTLRQDPAGISDATLVGLGQSLVAVHDATFLLGPGFVVGVGNGLILGYLMYRSELVRKRMAWFGLIGGPLLAIATIPEIIWEAFLGLYLTFKGFNMASPVFDGSRDAGADAA